MCFDYLEFVVSQPLRPVTLSLPSQHHSFGRKKKNIRMKRYQNFKKGFFLYACINEINKYTNIKSMHTKLTYILFNIKV